MAILDVVAAKVPLTRVGDEHRGLCPFHEAAASEAAPTFYVIPKKGIFHCFGCGAYGDKVSFVMRWHGVTLPQAVLMLTDETS